MANKFKDKFNPEYIRKILIDDYFKFFSYNDYEKDGNTFKYAYKIEIDSMIQDMKMCKKYGYATNDYATLLKDEIIRSLGFDTKDSYSETYSDFSTEGYQISQPWHDIVWCAWMRQQKEEG